MRFKSIGHLRQKIQSHILKYSSSLKKNESGQSFIEFLFLLLILVALSFSLVKGFNDTVAKQWKAIVQAVAIPTDSNDDFEL
jgi:hypothetical protein